MQLASDSKYRNRAMLASWAHSAGASVEHYRGADGKWVVTATGSSNEETIIVTSGPQDTIEAGCVVVMEGLRDAGQTIRPLDEPSPSSG